MSRRTISLLKQMAVYMTILTGGSCGMMYYLMQKRFSQCEFYQLAIGELERNSSAMASLGCPPLKIHNIRLTDSHNRVDQSQAQLKIPVKGQTTGGYLYTSSSRNTEENRWELQEVFLRLREGEIIEIFSKSPSEQ